MRPVISREINRNLPSNDIIESMSLFQKTRNLYGRFERPISSLSLFAGFLFDILTLKRLDTLWENLWILGHLIIIGVFILLLHMKEGEPGDEADPSKPQFWFINILQFVFGGVLSAFLVFYFRSTDIWTTWPFLLILILAFVANESFKRHYVRLNFQISLFFLSIYAFAIYLIPVLLHKIGLFVFLLSGLFSYILIRLFIKLIFHFKDKKNEDEDEEQFKNRIYISKKAIKYIVVGILLLVNFLYFTNLIPPIPLSLKDAGIYHSIEKNKDGNYNVIYEDIGWKSYFKLYPDFNKNLGDSIYIYSAIFSPKNLNIKIIHEWQYYDDTVSKWKTESTISLSVIGGRDGGFRTYSKRSNISPGKWRVNIKTEQGQTIGHLRFNLVSVDNDGTKLYSSIKK